MTLLHYVRHFHAPVFCLSSLLCCKGLYPHFTITPLSKGPSEMQPSLITSHNHGLLCGPEQYGYNSSSIYHVFLSLIVREVCTTISSAPPEACLLIATFFLFRLLGTYTHIVGSKKMLMSVRALTFVMRTKGSTDSGAFPMKLETWYFQMANTQHTEQNVACLYTFLLVVNIQQI